MEKHNSFMSIIERLGNVLYWAGCLGVIPTAVYVYGQEMDKYTDSDLHEPLIFKYALLCGLSVWLIGLASRYVLNGRGLWRKKS